MSDTIRESSPMITPDSLRKINQVNQAFYETHTKKNFGRSDVYGSQYSGTVENFGFEMLLEARKIRMEKPSLKGVFGINRYQYYFDIQYSNMIETYEQQGMLEAVLRKDVFLPNKEYRIQFTNCRDVYIPRSESWGALNEHTKSKVFKDKFIYTNKAPKLLVKDLSSGVVEEIDLRLEVGDGFETNYYFYNAFATEKFIDSYVGGELITVPITNNDVGLPFVWICVDIFKSLPPVHFEGNVPIANKPILTIGVDGHDVSHIYPMLYGIGSLPDQPSIGKWYLKAFSDLDGFILRGSNNHASKISSINYVFKPDDGTDEINYQISFEEEYIKISLSDKVEWNIVRDQINEPYHAEISMDVFTNNGSSDITTVLIEAFDIGFSDLYLFNPYEGLCEDATTGVHVDILSDYSENSTPKKNGVIHSLGEFDGLPTYFKSFHDRTIHRSHVELYAIRDRLNRQTQDPTKKQTASLLIDSAMPQKELENLVNDQEPAIVYQYDPNKYLYVTDLKNVISNKNVVSEITFNNPNNFGNCRIPAHSKKPRFIYHGNRTFSLSNIEFDPELEMARVYYVNNDSISYVNNSTLPSNDKKSPLAMARICDIPTTYEQLMHIDNVAATYLFDKRYVRMGASFYNDDMILLRNTRGLKIVMTPGEIGDQWVYKSEKDLPTKQQLVDAGYSRTVNINNSDVTITSANFKVLAGGTGYSVGDTFYVLVGGKAYDGVIKNIILGGHVPENNPDAIEITVSDDSKVSIYNTDGTNTSLKTVTVSSELGTGLQIELVISASDIASHKPIISSDIPPQDGLISFAQDPFENIFLYSLDYDWNWVKVCQVEGTEIRENPYDRSNTRDFRTFEYAFNRHLFDSHNYANEDIFFKPMEYIQETVITDYAGARGHKGDADTTDLSEYIVDRNMPNTFYKLICVDNADNGHFNLEIFELKSLDDYKVTLPRFNTNNTVEHYNHSNRFILSFAETLNKVQPTLFVYSPSHNIKLDGYNIMTDIILNTSSHITNYNDYGSNIMTSSGELECNVYYYPEYEFSDEYNTAKENFAKMHRSELITYIRDVIGKDSEPLKFEDTDYKYTDSDLIGYIMERYPLDGPYIKNGLKVHGYAGDQVINTTTGAPLGKPVTGGIVPLTTEVVDVNVTVDGKKEHSEPVNIFIIDDVTFQGFSNNFKVHDENGVDITSTSIIIWKGNKYIFRDAEWIQLAKPVMEEYYNPNDKMFYYDQQYSNIITPDPDIIYCDITTGQYYKWNGSNYMLITI